MSNCKKESLNDRNISFFLLVLYDNPENNSVHAVMMKKIFDKDWDFEQYHDIIKDITKPLQPQQPKQFHNMKINKESSH